MAVNQFEFDAYGRVLRKAFHHSVDRRGNGQALRAIGQAVAGADGYEWRDHRAPFDFEFENHMDTHQQSQLTGAGGLTGFLYITPSDRTTTEGVPIAMHGDCTENPDGCTVAVSNPFFD